MKFIFREIIYEQKKIQFTSFIYAFSQFWSIIGSENSWFGLIVIALEVNSRKSIPYNSPLLSSSAPQHIRTRIYVPFPNFLLELSLVNKKIS